MEGWRAVDELIDILVTPMYREGWSRVRSGGRGGYWILGVTVRRV